MKVGIGLKLHAYTPEAYAYSKYLSNNGVSVQLDYESVLDVNNDINIYFMGIRPFWKLNRGRAVEIHEYQSLSTGNYPGVKDFIKKMVNRKPVGRIFLNDLVHKNIGFSDKVPFIYRDMGIDSELFQKPVLNPQYDIVYAGSIAGRVGLIDTLLRLATLNFKLLIIGDVRSLDREIFNSYSNVHFTGRVERHELASLYGQCKAGLNYTPDIYPFNIQTSTKTLEYLASGLLVISNRYKWSSDFFHDKKSSVIWLEDFADKDYLHYHAQKYQAPDMNDFTWDRILSKSNFFDFLTESLR